LPTEIPSQILPATLGPTSATSNEPTLIPVSTRSIEFDYDVGFQNGFDNDMADIYEDQINKSMQSLAAELIDDVFEKKESEVGIYSSRIAEYDSIPSFEGRNIFFFLLRFRSTQQIDYISHFLTKILPNF